MSDSDGAIKRIALTEAAFEKLRSFSRGMDKTYSETIELVMALLIGPDEDPMMAGKRLKVAIEQAQQDALEKFKRERLGKGYELSGDVSKDGTFIGTGKPNPQ